MKKPFIVTDPCYLIKDAAVWISYCDLISSDRHEEGDRLLSDHLGTEIRTAETGYGDWSNDLACVRGNSGLISGEFCADAGRVCFCEFTPAIKSMMEQEYGECGGRGTYALILAENPSCTFDRDDPFWTVVRITDGDSAYYSREADDDYDYSDDDDDDDYY